MCLVIANFVHIEIVKDISVVGTDKKKFSGSQIGSKRYDMLSLPTIIGATSVYSEITLTIL